MRRILLAVALFLLTLTACEKSPPPPPEPKIAIIDPPPGQHWVPPTPTPAQRAQRQATLEAARRASREALIRERIGGAVRAQREDPGAAANSRAIREQQRMDLEERRRTSAANYVLIAPEGFGPNPNDPLR